MSNDDHPPGAIDTGRSVDVIVPCYRYGHYLAQCVESIVSQDNVSARVLVIDDASPDNSGEVAEELAHGTDRVTVIRHKANAGHIRTYNEGIEWASSSFMLLLSADDFLLPGALDRAVSLFNSEPSVGFTFGNALALRDSGERKRFWPFGDKARTTAMKGSEFIARAGANNIVPTPTAVVRTSVQKQTGGYNSLLPHSGDMEMWLRIAARADVGFVYADQAVYRMHGSNMSHAYSGDMMPDLIQRKAAIDSFIASSEEFLPSAAQTRATLYASLAVSAVRMASIAFNQGRPELCQTLCDHAVATSPSVRATKGWRNLAIKRRIGHGAWRLLASIRDRTATQES